MKFSKKEVKSDEPTDLIELVGDRNVIHTLSRCKWGPLQDFNNFGVGYASRLDQTLPSFFFEIILKKSYEDSDFTYRIIPGTSNPVRVPKVQPAKEEKTWKTIGKIKDLIT